MSRTGIKNKQPLHKWTKEELDFVRETYQTYDINKTLIIFNEHFNLSITKAQLKGIMNRYKICCGRDTKWQNGTVPPNKGKKWDDFMPKESQANSRKTTFKKGIIPANSVPVGTEYDFGGYIIVRTTEDTGAKNRRYWKLKHHLVWEAANGKVPKGYNVIFADGNTRNFDLDNLVLVSDEELALMNTQKLYFKDNADATKSGALIAKIHYKRKELIKCQKTR